MRIFEIATLGTSLTAGSGAKGSYHRDLELALQVGKESRIRTHNFGIPGGTTANAIYQRASNIKPQVILIEFTTNDCLGTLTTAATNTTNLVNNLKSASPESGIFLMLMNPIITGRSTGATSRAPLVGDFDTQYVSLASSLNIGLINAKSGWSGTTMEDIPDGLHPTVANNKQFLVPVIALAISGRIV